MILLAMLFFILDGLILLRWTPRMVQYFYPSWKTTLNRSASTKEKEKVSLGIDRVSQCKCKNYFDLSNEKIPNVLFFMDSYASECSNTSFPGQGCSAETFKKMTYVLKC